MSGAGAAPGERRAPSQPRPWSVKRGAGAAGLGAAGPGAAPPVALLAQSEAGTREARVLFPGRKYEKSWLQEQELL